MNLRSIQYLRATAAIMVVFNHIPLQQFPGWGAPERLASGVDIFFIISGFIMFVTTRGKKMSPIEFWRRRVKRIVPLYWLLTTAIVGATLIAPSVVAGPDLDAYHVLASYLFFPAVDESGRYLPVLFQGWTLNYEMFFYLLFGAALVLHNGRRLLVGSLVVFGALGIEFQSFYTSSIVVEFAVGMCIGRLYMRGWTTPRLLCWPAVIIGFALIVLLGRGVVGGGMDGSFTRLLLWGAPASMIVIGAVSAERHGQLPRSRLFGLMGDASYSTYLVHALYLAALYQAWIWLGITAGPVPYIAFAAITASAVGIATYLVVEKPLIDSRIGESLKRLVFNGKWPKELVNVGVNHGVENGT